jgi:hypothetical protein
MELYMTSRRCIFTGFAFVLLFYIPYYVYTEMGWIVQMTFADPERWNRSSWADNDAVIPFIMRLFYLVLWTAPIAVGTLALLIGALICWSVRLGDYFNLLLARKIFWLGTLMIIGAALAILAGSISPMLVSWYNVDGQLPLRFWHGSNLTIMLAGFAFIMFGSVMRDAIALADENKGFV